jgi:hypothetical protein
LLDSLFAQLLASGVKALLACHYRESKPENLNLSLNLYLILYLTLYLSLYLTLY